MTERERERERERRREGERGGDIGEGEMGRKRGRYRVWVGENVEKEI